MEISGNKCDRLKQVRAIRPTRRSVSGIYPFRGVSSVAYESTLERDFVVRYEFFNNVYDVVPQPTVVEWRDSRGKPQTYTPDYVVYFRAGTRSVENYPKPILAEIKPRQAWKAHWREWAPKWMAARRYAINEGYEFRIYDETRIRDVAFENVTFLERYKRMRFDEARSAQLLQTVGLMDVTTMDFLLARYFGGPLRAEGIAHIWHLLAMRKLDCNIHEPLGLLTPLWVTFDE